jgi:hypothetical protein
MLAFLIYGLISQYLFLTVLGGLTFIIIIRSLWKPFTPPVLLFFIMFHWLQVFSSILYADFKGYTIDVLFNSEDTNFLFFFTFLQIMIVSLFMEYFIKSSKTLVSGIDTLKLAAQKLNIRNVVIGYFITLGIIPVLISIMKNNPSLLQLVFSIYLVKHLFTALLIFIFLLRKTSNKWLIGGILTLDFILSFASFFSDFKTILIMIIIIYYTVNPYLRKASVYKMAPVIIILVMFFSFWSYIKGEYRNFLNQGTNQQVVSVSNKDALTFLFSSLEDFDTRSLQEGLSLFMYRAQYMERYSEVYARVPEIIPHQDGKDLSDAIQFLVVPRFINENKGVKDASQRTSYYTGRTFSNAAQGTSISMGYFCDLFIDFGLYLMILPLLAFMAIIGLTYKKILSIGKYNVLFTFSILIGTFLSLGTFESDSIYFLGVLRNTIAFLALGYFTFFSYLHKFIFAKAK